MKKIWKALSLPVLIAALAVCLAVSGLAFSEEDAGGFDFLEAESFRSVLTDVNGDSVTVDGVLDLSTLSAHPACRFLAHYDLYCGDERIMAVDLKDVGCDADGGKGAGRADTLNGWYAVEFRLDDTRTCYLTGLTGKNLMQVEAELVASKLQDRYFAMTNVDFLDVEKNYLGDSQLCWAASTSDVLEYTGWARLAGFDDADDLFDAYVAAFDDVAGNPRYAIEWFFNGLNRPQDLEWDGWANADRYDGSFTGFLPEYEATTVLDYINVKDRPLSRVDDAFRHLRDGWGVSILIGWYYNSSYRNGGHLIALWGYIEDTAAQGRARYPALIVSDSDSDIVTGADRRDAPNRYRILMSDPYDKFGMDTYSLDYDAEYNALLEDFCCLQPWSPEVATEQYGTKNKFTAPDVVFDGADFHTADGVNPEVFTAGLPITVRPAFYNMSRTPLTGGFAYRLDVLDEAGAVVCSGEGSYGAELPAFSVSEEAYADPLFIEPLPAGDYTLRIVIDPERLAGEAYTVNNTDTVTISLRASEADVSGAALTLEAPGFNEKYFSLAAGVSYEGLDALYADCESYSLFFSYLEDGKWSPFEEAHTLEDDGEMPTLCMVDARGEKLKAILVLKPLKEGEPSVVLESAPVDLVYDSIAVEVSPRSHGECRLRAGDTAFADGGQFVFTVKNVSNTGNTLTYNGVMVYACNVFDESDRVTLSSRYEPTALKPGESSGEFVCAELTDTDGMAGEYTVYAQVYGDWGDSLQVLGTLHAEADRVVFYSADCTMDGLSASFEAVAYVPFDRNEGTVRVRLTEGSNASVINAYLSGCEELGGNVCRFYSDYPVQLKENTTYYWQPCYYSYSSQNYDAEEWMELTTGSLAEFSEVLELGKAASGTCQYGGKYNYSFTAPADGGYAITGTSANYLDVNFWDPARESWSSLLYTYAGAEKATTVNRMLTAGETLYLQVTGNGDFTLCVDRGADFPTAFSAPELTVTADYFETAVRADAAVPYGANLRLCIDYGTETEYQTYDSSQTNCVSGAVSLSRSLTLLPGESVSVRARLTDSDTGAEYAGAWQQVTGPTPDAKTLTPDQTETVELERNANAYFVFEAPEDGTYFVSFAGEEGSVRIFTGGSWSHIASVWNDETTGATPVLTKGTKYYLAVSAYGDSRFSLKLLRWGAMTGERNTSGFTASLTMTAVVPPNYGDYTVGVECTDGILLDLGTPSIKTLSVKASGSGEITETFEMEYCPGVNMRWRAFLRSSKTGEEYLSGWTYLGGWMNETYVTAGVPVSVTAEQGSLFLSFLPQENNVYAASASGEGGALLRWDPEALAWKEQSFSAGADAVFSFSPAYYVITYMAGSGGAEQRCRTEYFRLDLAAGDSASFTILPTKDTSSSVATGEASPEAFSAELGLTAALGYGADVRLGVTWGIEPARMNYAWAEIPAGADTGSLALTVTADTLPGTAYRYRAVLFDKKHAEYVYGEWKSFTTPAAADALTELKLDVLSEKRASARFVFTAPQDGIYTLTASASDVRVSVCGTDGLWRDHRLDADGGTVSFRLSAGERLYIRQEGEASLLMTGGFACAEFDADGKRAVVWLMPEEDGLYVAAAYSRSGKQLACSLVTLKALERKQVELSADEAVGWVKVFCLNETAYSPVSVATALAAPEA